MAAHAKYAQKGPTCQSRVVTTWADVLNRAGLGMEVKHERNTHNLPPDLAAATAILVSLAAPLIFPPTDGLPPHKQRRFNSEPRAETQGQAWTAAGCGA